MFNKFRNSILGFVLGDAVGVPFEFTSRYNLGTNPAKDMIGNGTHNQPIGTWSDDSSMMFILMEWLINNKKNNIRFEDYSYKEYQNLKDLWKNWKDKGYWTPHGKCFDVGNQTKHSLNAIELFGENSIDSEAQGNGAMMRSLPFAFLLNGNISKENRFYIEQILTMTSNITHGSSISNFYTKKYVDLVCSFIKPNNYDHSYGVYKTKGKIPGLSNGHSPETYNSVLHSISTNNIEYVECVEYFLYLVDVFKNKEEYFKNCILKAINLGEDTDTVAALTGGVVGSLFDLNDVLPQDWLMNIVKFDSIEILIKDFYETFKKEIES